MVACIIGTGIFADHSIFGFPVSKCTASRYMSGHCGGTTRVVVLVGGKISVP
jgi:hypothetical protein